MVEEGPEGLPDLSVRQALAVMGAAGRIQPAPRTADDPPTGRAEQITVKSHS